MINEKDAQDAIRKLLSAFNIDNTRHTDIEKTPERVVKMLTEVWQGEQYSNAEIAKLFGKTFDSDSAEMVIMADIPCFSYCEHHLALIYNLKISVGYLPHGKVIGLSKTDRITFEMFRSSIESVFENDKIDITKPTCDPKVALLEQFQLLVWHEVDQQNFKKSGVKQAKVTRYIKKKAENCSNSNSIFEF